MHCLEEKLQQLAMSFLLGLHKLCMAWLVVYIYNLYIAAGNGGSYYFVYIGTITVKITDCGLPIYAATATFMVKPGGGEEYITTPVGKNATLECSAINTTMLRWTVNTFDPNFLDSELSGLILHQSGPITASTGEMTSTLIVNGTVQRDRIDICCQITGPQQCCTNLIIYGNYFM